MCHCATRQQRRRIMYLTNVVCSAHLGCAVTLRELCGQLENARYEPSRFPGLIWQHGTIGGNCLIFSNGKIQCQGKAKSFEEGIQRQTQYARELQRLGLSVELKEIKVITVSAFHTLSSDLDLNTLVTERQLIYEPELFPAAILKQDGVTFSCFSNGKIVMTGIKNGSDVNQVVTPTLLELELYTRST
jgi:transcription initiation factor TFIID TATA-box-binding protein